MRRIRRLALLAAILLCALTVSCDFNTVEKVQSTATFNTSTTKALNPEAKADSTSATDVSQFYWMYYVGEEAPDENSEFRLFEDLCVNNTYNKGLGTISGLSKGEVCYFALKGFYFFNNNNSGAGNEGCSELRWYGVSAQYKITTGNMKINLAVAPAGKGTLAFDFKALRTDVKTSGTNANLEADWFEISFDNITDGEELQPILAQGTVDGSLVVFKSQPQSVECGCYMVTVRQCAKPAEGPICYVENRAQVLLIQIASGVTTTVKGSLDSSVKEAN